MKSNKNHFYRSVLAGICFAGLEISIYKFSLANDLVRMAISFAIATVVALLMHFFLSNKNWTLQVASVTVSLFVIASLLAVITLSRQESFSFSDLLPILQLGFYGLAVYWRQTLVAIVIYVLADRYLNLREQRLTPNQNHSPIRK